MPDRVLHLYLPDPMRQDAMAGRVNILNRTLAALAPSGWKPAFHPDTPEERAKAGARRGRALFHMQEPLSANTLCLRRAYFYPFWQIEATNERWNFDVAQAAFVAVAVAGADRAGADAFVSRWRGKLLGDGAVRRDGFILMPLQGRLLQQRSFQTDSPLGMIAATLAADPARRVVATLHPREVYPQEEQEALAEVARRHPRFSLQPPSEALILSCDYIVTQNSSVALTGFFAGKPAVQFARTDAHHIAASVPRDGVAAAFAQAQGPLPDFTGYLAWFFRDHCINGGAPDAEAQILSRFRRHGWAV